MDGNFSQATGTHQNSRIVSRRGKHPPGSGRADGSAGGNAGGGSTSARPCFDVAVAPNGYRWWYIDALSDDGQYGLAIIAFVGSVFSPYYARARKNGVANPENHCAINVAFYGAKRRWAMTERGARHVMRQPHHFAVGRSTMSWDENGIAIAINEHCAPLPFPLRGRVILIPGNCYDAPVALDTGGRHHWQAVAPSAKIAVEFSNPKLAWSGAAYHDMNWGEEPLEQAFRQWTWLRTNTTRGTEVLYDVERKDGSRFAFGRCFRDGSVTERFVPDRYPLRRGVWGMSREVRSEAPPRLIATLEDAPFYTRNRVGLTLDGVECEAFHESLSLDRLVNPIVQMMLPFRMPRLA
jgi:carotenoid 1,2-hydratase